MIVLTSDPESSIIKARGGRFNTVRRFRVRQKELLIRSQSRQLQSRLAGIYSSTIDRIISSFGIRKAKVNQPDDWQKFVEQLTTDTGKQLTLAASDVYRKNIGLPGSSGNVKIVGAVTLDLSVMNNDDMRRVQAGVDFGLGDKLTADYVRRQRVKLKGIARDDAVRIKNKVADLVAAEVDEETFVEQMRGLSDAMSEGRAQSVARNLSASAYSEARSDFWSEQAPDHAQRKEWYPSIGGEHDREHHNDIPARGAVPFEGKFIIDSPYYGSIKADYPNAPDLYANYPGEAINCACDYGILFD